MALLVYLAERPRQVVRAEALLDDLWPGKVVTNATLYNCVAELRKELDDESTDSASVQTIPKKGYRLLLPVSGLEDEPNSVGRRRLAMAAILSIVAGYFLIDYLIDRIFPSVEQSIDPSVAVLPFTSFTPDPDDEYFSDGLTAELINTLARLENLRVTGRTSSFYYKERHRDLRAIGSELGVDHIIEGSVRHVGDTRRISVRLIKADNGFQIWSDTYDRQTTDILAIQADIARQVTAALQPRFRDGREMGLYPGDTKSADAQTKFLVARGHVRRGRATWRHSGVDVEHLRVARRLLEEAVEIDPEFAEAWAMLTHAYWLLHGYSDESGELLTGNEVMALAGPAAERAIALAPDLSESWVALGYHLTQSVLTITRNHEELIRSRRAESAFERALQLAPDNVRGLESYAFYRLKRGEYKPALELLDRAVAIDPLSRIRQSRALAMYRTGQIAAARREYLEVGRLYPDAPYEAGIAEIEFDRGHLHHGLLWIEGIDNAPYPTYAWASLGDISRALRTNAWWKKGGGNNAAVANLQEFILLGDYRGLREAAPSSTAITRFWHLKVALYFLRQWKAAVSLIENWPVEPWRRYNLEDLTGTGDARERQYDVSHRGALATHAAYHAHALAQVGRYDEAASVRRWAFELINSRPLTTPRYIQERHQLRLLVLASRGDVDSALSELEAMVEAGWHWTMSPAWVNYHAYSAGIGWFEDSPLLDSIRDEPRFAKILEEVRADNAAMLAELEAGLTLEDIREESIN